MPDYGRELEFGASVEPLADPPEWAARVAKAADEAGLDLLGIQDHPYQRRFLDTWTLISTLVPQTENLRFFPDVASLPLRPPAMLAKSAASLDVLSGGRIELGLGAGAFWDAIEAMDGPRRSPGEAVRSVEEAIQVMRLVWSEERSLRFEGEIYALKGMRPGPKPPHEIGVWVGAYGPKMLNLIGRLADGWVPSLGYVQPDQLPGMHERIDRGALEAGREPREIQRILNVSGIIGENGDGLLEGPASKWVEELSRLVLEIGFDTFVYWPREDHVRQVDFSRAKWPLECGRPWRKGAVGSDLETHRRSALHLRGIKGTTKEVGDGERHHAGRVEREDRARRRLRSRGRPGPTALRA